MKIRPAQSSEWMIEFHKQIVRCKHVLLYGNVADQFLLNGQYCTLLQFLDNYFVEQGYEIVGQYDVVDGFRFHDDLKEDQMFQQCRQIVRQTMKNRQVSDVRESSDSAASEAISQEPPPVLRDGRLGITDSDASTLGEPAGRTSPLGANWQRSARQGDTQSTQSPRSQHPQGVPRSRQGTGLPPANFRFSTRRIPLEQALDTMRMVLSQSQHSAALVVHFADKLVNHREQIGDEERSRVIQLMKISENAAFLSQPPLQRRKNSLVIVAGELAAVPDSLHKERPFVSPVRVTLPRTKERAAFVSQFQNDFHEGRLLDEGTLNQVADDFANLTEGLTAWDLDAILRTSIEERLSIRTPAKLVNFYRYGVVEDPWQEIDKTRIQRASRRIRERVIGQPQVINAVCDMLVSAKVGVSMADPQTYSGKPKGVFFFVGPTGVGKTEMAKAATELVFSDESAFARFDMSEFAEQHSAERLTGAPPGFVGHEEGGQLTDRVQRRPFSLLLFDEIEKADGHVMDKFLQILEDGRLTDGKGQTAYFSQAAIIFTSNIGTTDLEQLLRDGKALPRYEEIRDMFLSAVRDHFTHELKRPEILNRLGDNIIVFDMLRSEYVPGICRKFQHLLVKSARENSALTVAFPDDGICRMIAEMMSFTDLRFGGRRIRTLMETLVERPLNRWIFQREPPRGAKLDLTADPERGCVLVNGEPVAPQHEY